MTLQPMNRKINTAAYALEAATEKLLEAEELAPNGRVDDLRETRKLVQKAHRKLNKGKTFPVDASS